MRRMRHQSVLRSTPGCRAGLCPLRAIAAPDARARDGWAEEPAGLPVVAPHLMERPAWEVNSLPADPPAGCRDAQRWRHWHGVHARHRPNQAGQCAECYRTAFPCFMSKLAVRALLDACASVERFRPLPGPPHVVGVSSCRWPRTSRTDPKRRLGRTPSRPGEGRARHRTRKEARCTP